MTSVTDFSYSPSEEEKTRNAAQIAATGRRNWKTLRGKGEAVWPPHLYVESVLFDDEEQTNVTCCHDSEAVLLEGELYLELIRGWR